MTFEPVKTKLFAAADNAGFTNRTDAENLLLETVATGAIARCKDLPDEQRTVRSNLLEWLLIHPDPRPLLHPKGVQLFDAVFKQELDLEEARIDIPLWFQRCTFEAPVILRRARTRTLIFQACTVPSLNANGVQVDGNVFLRNKFHAAGKVNLQNATIGGNLECNGSRFENESGDALSADRIDVKGSVYLRNGFHATGLVRLPGATIGGNLDCEGSCFENESGLALAADRINVKGYVFLRNNFSSKGKVLLSASRIEGSLQLQSSELRCGQKNDDPVALDLTNASIKDSLSFVDHWDHDEPAKIHGQALLRHAHVGQFDDSPAVWGLDDSESTNAEQKPEPVPVALDGFTYASLGRDKQSLEVKFRQRWLKSGEAFPGPFAPQPYTQLAQALRAAGHEDRARLILMQRNWERLRRLKHELGKGEYIWSVLFGCVVGFGYRTRRALVGLLFFWLLGFVVFMSGWYAGKFNPAVPFIYNSYKVSSYDAQGVPVEEQRHQPPYTDLTENPHRLKQYPKFYSIVYSLDTLLPVVNLHQEPYWLPEGCVRAYLWIHILAGWFFTTMLVVGLTGLVRKD